MGIRIESIKEGNISKRLLTVYIKYISIKHFEYSSGVLDHYPIFLYHPDVEADRVIITSKLMLLKYYFSNTSIFFLGE